jgi:hypothetical protein
MTRLEVAKLVAVLRAAYPTARGDDSTSSAYETMLADLDHPTAYVAVERLIATSKFMPSVAEIREAYMDLMHGDRRAGGEAWGECLAAISRWGAYRSPGVDFTFRDPLVARVVAALGWTNLCGSENQVADRARFVELYDRLAVGARKSIATESLPGATRLRELQAADGGASGLVLQLAAAKSVKP